MVDVSLITFVDGGNILVKPDAKVARLNDLEGRRVAVISGTTTEKVLRASLAQRKMKSEVVPVTTRGEGLKLLDDGRVDGFAADRTTLIGIAATTPSKAGGFMLLDEDFSVEPYVFGLPRGDPDFRLAVNRVLARIFRTNDIVRIYNRWLGSLGPPSLLLSAAYFLQAIEE
jgi:ABC-type amino acid transport substrate-binding protein